METSKEYYDKVMSDYRSRGARRSPRTAQQSGTSSHFIPLSVEDRDIAERPSEADNRQKPEEWRIRRLILAGPHGEIEISGGSTPALLSLMASLRQEAE